MAVKQVFNTSAELDFPNVLPTLDLDFANSKTLDPRITFTRASGGSYVGADGLIKYAGVNEARFDHDPVTGESLGLLIEEARTNLLLRSEEFDNSYWSKPFGATVNPNVSISPNGTLTADKVNNFNGTPAIRKGNIFSAGTTYTVSIFAKAAEFKYFTFLVLTDTGISSLMVNLEEGVYLLGANSLPKINQSMVSYGGGWYRISMSFTTTTVSSGNYFDIRPTDVWPSGTTGILPQNPDGQRGIYLWGAQLEVGAFPTSYIPTQGSTRTRAADNASITGKNFSEWYRQIGYTIFSEHITARPSSVFPRVFNISTSTDSFRLNHYQPPQANYVGFSAINNNINFADIRYFNITQSVKAKMATSYDFNNVVLYVNGDFVGRDITNPYPSQNRDRINIGSATPSGSYINSTISKITYYPYPLKDSNLQSLTS
jgi:hypothetical protein